MHSKIIFFLLVSATAIIGFSCKGGSGTGAPDPEITGIQPEEGPVGTTVTISGSGFGPEAPDNTVTFDGEEAEVSSASDSELQTAVPENATTGPVKVSVGDKTASGPIFTVKAEAPGIKSVEPDSGVAGTEVVITGMNFSAVLSENTVTFNGVEAEVTNASEDELITRVPNSASDGPVKVIVEGEAITGPDFDVITYGALEVKIATSGNSKDGDGYALEVNGKSKGSAIADTVYFNYLEEDSYGVQITGVAGNCAVEGENPKYFDIIAGDTTAVDVEVKCRQALNNKIVFVSDRSGQEDLYVMNSDGTDVSRLTETPGGERHPAISQDGTQIAYWQQDVSAGGSYGAIWVINADGTDPVQLTSVELGTFYPVWSPNGERIIFSKGGEIYVMNADGSGRQTLTSSSDFDFAPSWSPNGETITFTSDRSGSGRDIYVMSANGSGLENITNDSFYNAYSSWSPDGSQIAFLSNESDPDDIYVPYDLYVMDADGGNRTKIADLSITGYASGDKAGPPSWSPDGTKIVLGDRNGSNHEIYVINADGSGTSNRITLNTGIDNIYPHWSPVE